jgi:hypothetical protein
MKLAAGASPPGNARIEMSILHDGATAAPHSSHGSLSGRFRILMERVVEVENRSFSGLAAIVTSLPRTLQMSRDKGDPQLWKTPTR